MLTRLLSGEAVLETQWSHGEVARQGVARWQRVRTEAGPYSEDDEEDQLDDDHEGDEMGVTHCRLVHRHHCHSLEGRFGELLCGSK